MENRKKLFNNKPEEAPEVETKKSSNHTYMGMDKNKLILPVSILLGCIILGGFYYASETNQQASIERQQQLNLQAQQEQQQSVTDQNNKIVSEKAACVTQAQQQAINEYETGAVCTGSFAPKDCKDGTTYLIAQYNSAYSTCLESNGLQ